MTTKKLFLNVSVIVIIKRTFYEYKLKTENWYSFGHKIYFLRMELVLFNSMYLFRLKQYQLFSLAPMHYDNWKRNWSQKSISCFKKNEILDDKIWANSHSLYYCLRIIINNHINIFLQAWTMKLFIFTCGLILCGMVADATLLDLLKSIHSNPTFQVI